MQGLLRKELSRMTAIVKQRRILLKEWFMAEDARREEVVTQHLFMRCLRSHGLWPDVGPDAVDEADNTGFLAGKEGLVGGLLLEAFRASTPRRAVPLGRDPVFLGQSFVNYVSFCGAVEPKHGGRDLDDQRRVLDKAWKAKPKSPRSGQPSPTQVLSKHPASGRSWDSGAGGGGKGGKGGKGPISECPDTEVLPARAPMACEFNKSRTAGGPGQLDHWERIELKRSLDGQGGSTPPAKHFLTRKQAFSGIKKMVVQGRRPRIYGIEPQLSSDDDSLNNLSGIGEGGSGSVVAAIPDGSSRTNLDVLFDAAAALSSSASSSGGGAAATAGRNGVTNKGGGGGGGGQEEGEDPQANVGVLLRTLEEGVSAPGGVGPLEWDWLSGEEARDRARMMYREASHAQRRMQLMADEEDEAVRQEADQIRSKIAVLTRNAARLEALASASPSSDTTGGRPRGGEATSSSSLRLGRVDVFFATEFHGGPFQEQEGGNDGDINNRNQNTHDFARGGNGGLYSIAASASQSVCCDATVSTAMSSGPAERRGAGGGGDDGCVVKDTEPPWFSQHVLTAG
ncbi:unnamed protein product [Ectocarpus sp. 12 AP-2014]